MTKVSLSPSCGLTNRLLSVVRPRMADKTSWTKPPSLHRYGDSRLTAPPSEERGYADGSCDHPKVAVSGRVRKAGAAYRRREMRSARARRAGGERSIPVRKRGDRRGDATERSRGVQDRNGPCGRGHRGQDLGDVQPSLPAAGTAFDVDAGQAEHEGGHGFGGRRDEGRRLGEEGAAPRELGAARPVRQEAEMADADKPARHDVEEKATDELLDVERHDLSRGHRRRNPSSGSARRRRRG